MPTKPINNTGYGLNQRFAYFYQVRKIFWILLWPGKEKTKQKDFAMCVAGRQTLVCSRTVHSSTVSINCSEKIHRILFSRNLLEKRHRPNRALPEIDYAK
ncbi:hypothetical protein, partial [Cochleicola gelatinilyticus]|uniref:hypothetical protein n=1 Tax=Cochleicola gelatinilyticus TaxID=1763537 RepID=UPI001A7E0656